MKSYDYIVVGSGIAGLTATRILAQHGHSVLLLEKALIVGGSMARFRLGGVPFDVGFHFTGGFTDDRTGMMDGILARLGVADRIKPIFFPHDACHRMIIPSAGIDYGVPAGNAIIREQFKKDFPHVSAGIDKFFDRMTAVVDATPTLNVAGFDETPAFLDEDLITLQEVLDDCVPDPLVQTLLGGMCLCYGTRPDQVSFSNHCRVAWGLQETLARTEDGGDAFVEALIDVMKNDRVEIRLRTTVEKIVEVENKKATRFVLTDGSEVTAKACIFAIHPHSILETLPKEHLSKAFQNRVADFEPSNGFFTLYGTIDAPPPDSAVTLCSILPSTNLNEMLTCRSPEPVDGAMMVLRSLERGATGPVHTVTALEVSFPESTQNWESTKLKRRPAEYYKYKDSRTESVVARMHEHLPICRKMNVIDTASSLTYRDYLCSPDGSAYGIRQKMGQINVMGKLPIHNLYAAGQSALLPGVLGAMVSAFFVCRSILGRETFREYLAGKTCCSTV